MAVPASFGLQLWEGRENEWMDRLRDKAAEIADTAKLDGAIKAKVVQKMIAPLRVALTAPEFDPDPTNNYEVMELAGDKMMNTNIVLWFMTKFKDHRNPQDMSQAVSELGSEVYVTRMANELGLAPLIRVKPGPVPYKTVSDAFEAVVFALYLAVNAAVPKLQMGHTATRSFMDKLLNKLDYEFSELTMDTSRSFLNEIYVAQNWGKFGEYEKVYENPETKETTVTLYAPIDGNNVQIGKATSRKKKEAMKLAAVEAVKTLESFGIKRQKRSIIERNIAKTQRQKMELAQL